MQLKSIILKLQQSGDLQELFQQGFISSKVIIDKDIFLTCQTHLQTGMKKTEAVYATAVQWKISDDKVWKVIRTMEEK